MSKAKKTDDSNTICRNRRAFHKYEITDRLEAGLVLTGTEVKSCRMGKAQLNDAHVRVMSHEAFLIGCHIDEYSFGNRFNHDPLRTRKLLLHRREIDKLETQLNQRGYTAIPLSLYFKNGNVKLQLGLARGKAMHDRRQDLKERETERDIARVLRRKQR